MKIKRLFSTLMCAVLIFALLPATAWADTGMADLTVTATSPGTPSGTGVPVNFSITLRNDGPDDATGVSIWVPLPAAVFFDDASTAHGTYDNSTAIWTVGDLADGAQVVLTIYTHCLSVEPITASAAIMSVDQDDPDNSFSVSDGNIIVNDYGYDMLTVTYGAGGTESAPFPATQNITITGSTTTNTVVVAGGVTANITLDNVRIDLSGAAGYVCALDMANATVNLTLVGSNTLKSRGNAGLRAPDGSTLNIGGAGELTAVARAVSLGSGVSVCGAGIGGKDGEAGGSITISGGTVRSNGLGRESAG